MDLLNPPFDHRARYDDDGNIVLPSPNCERTVEEMTGTDVPVQQYTIADGNADEKIVEWIITEDSPADLHAVETIAPMTPVGGPPVPFSMHVRERIVGLRTLTRGAVREGARQYRVSISSSIPLLQRATDDLRVVLRIVWDFLAQPVWVPGRKRTIKQHSRGTLFLLDILRFGGTFTAIFAVLFVMLNYQSFWQITRSRVETVLQSPRIESPSAGQDATFAETLNAQAAAAREGRERGDLMSYLPTVGPPENRIIIPKLKLNVPLTQPPTEALLRQDWTQVETDIQTALEGGVVHYPGTARPGQAGNFFVTGHSSYYPWAPGKYKTVFARLHDLQQGDEYWVYYKGDRHRYVVQGKKEVLPTDVSVLDQPSAQRISTLMTCTPIGTTLRRLIVTAQEVDLLTGEPLKVGERTEKGTTPAPKLEALPI